MGSGVTIWGSSWGTSWGNAWGVEPVSPSVPGDNIVTRGLGVPGGMLVSGGIGRMDMPVAVVLTGDIDVEHGGIEVSGDAATHNKASQYAGARPGGRHGVIPKSSFIVAEYQRQEIERQLARLVAGDISVEQSGFEISALGRVKSVRLVANASIDVLSSAECEASGEFVDVELEMMALLLAA